MHSTALTISQRLLILDLNGILIHRRYETNLDLEAPPGAYRHGNFFIWLRPGLKDFLDYIFEHFEVAIWSSAAKHNLDPLVEEIFGEYRERLLFVADQDYCQKVVPHDSIAKSKPLFLKNLDKAWAFSALKGRYDATNTLIVDDSDEKMINNPKECHFNPGTWTIETPAAADCHLMHGSIRKRLDQFIFQNNDQTII